MFKKKLKRRRSKASKNGSSINLKNDKNSPLAGLILKIIFILVGISVFVYLLFFLKIDSVSCKSQYGVCSSSIENEVQKAKGYKITKSKKLIKNILENNDAVLSYQIYLDLPKTINVEIIENKALFAVKFPNDQWYGIIDRSGKVLRISDKTNLIYLEIDSILNAGDMVDEEVLFALNLLSMIDLTYNINSSKIVNKSLHIELEDGIKVIFPLEGDYQLLIGSANLIISKLDRIEEENKTGTIKNVREIDLRFKNPVIR